MDALEAILTRHSISKVKSDPVPREIIEKLLHAAVQAPNHYQVRPWRFVVLTGKSREALGEVMAQALKKQEPGSAGGGDGNGTGQAFACPGVDCRGRG